MSTVEERGILLARPVNVGAVQKLVTHLAQCVMDRMAQGYRDKGEEVPKILLKNDAVRSTVPPLPCTPLPALHS